MAVVCVVGALLALVAGSALRTEFTASSLPEPGAWNHVAHQRDAGLRTHFSRDSMSNNTKPFRNVWMTHDRPSKRATPSTPTGWLALPKSFAAAIFQPSDDGLPSYAYAPDNRNILTLNCVSRC
jgi:hypothetical protein